MKGPHLSQTTPPPPGVPSEVPLHRAQVTACGQAPGIGYHILAQMSSRAAQIWQHIIHGDRTIKSKDRLPLPGTGHVSRSRFRCAMSSGVYGQIRGAIRGAVLGSPRRRDGGRQGGGRETSPRGQLCCSRMSSPRGEAVRTHFKASKPRIDHGIVPEYVGNR